MKDRLFSLLATCGLAAALLAAFPVLNANANGCSAPKCNTISPCILVPATNACEVGAHQTGTCSGAGINCTCLTPIVGGCNCIKN